MFTLKEITAKNEKTYIVLKDTETRKRFVRDALKEGVLFTDGSLPELDKHCEVIMLYSNKTIARLGWAGRIKYFKNSGNVPVVEY